MNSPTPQQIREARRKAGHTQAAAAALIHATRRAWQNWERGEREMHPGLFELYLRKVAEIPEPVQPKRLGRCAECGRLRILNPDNQCENCLSQRSQAMTLTTDTLNGTIVVRDDEGGVWWPHDEAAAEIQAADDPNAKALEICENQPMRGQWKQ